MGDSSALPPLNIVEPVSEEKSEVTVLVTGYGVSQTLSHFFLLTSGPLRFVIKSCHAEYRFVCVYS
jgi:hypothetical protein